MTDKHVFEELEKTLSTIMARDIPPMERLQEICEILKGEVDHYDWVGFYLVNSEKPDELILGPYSGEPTEHVKIPFGKGVCGQVAESNETMIVEDVAQADNYIPCSFKVKSEIVIPIFKNGEQVAQLDIDSHDIDPFGEEDVNFLESLCRNLPELL